MLIESTLVWHSNNRTHLVSNYWRYGREMIEDKHNIWQYMHKVIVGEGGLKTNLTLDNICTK